jgi:Methyltransferase FkbM domain
MMINVDNPTVSTVSSAFIDAARGAQGWEGQVWEKTIVVPVTTLDALIEAHGKPAFVKIDVEGFEGEVLAGMTRPVDVLSFEFTTIQREVAQTCIARCTALGFRRYNATIGESQELGDWRSAEDIARWLSELPHAANSGDIYARMA